MSRSPVQRFISELRRRHVPQTAAIYLVAAWAAIEFADVVVPNLNGPQWVVTAVIVAALVGFPVMLVVAWVFEWGPEGVHRMEAEAHEGPAIPGVRGESAPAPWLAALAVLVVGIGSALAVTFVLRSQGEQEAVAPGTSGSAGDATEVGQGIPSIGSPGDFPAVLPELGDSLRARMVRAFGALDSTDLSALADIGQEVAAQVGLGIVLSQPEQWRVGAGPAPAPLAERDTLMVEGMAYDTAGVVAVVVDGDTVASADAAQPTVPFSTRLIGRGSVGIREVVITAHTPDGREVRRAFQVIQLPAGTP